MQLSKLPKTLAIVGAGYIAIEFAFIFANLGSAVSLIVRKNILGKSTSFIKEVGAPIFSGYGPVSYTHLTLPTTPYV